MALFFPVGNCSNGKTNREKKKRPMHNNISTNDADFWLCIYFCWLHFMKRTEHWLALNKIDKSSKCPIYGLWTDTNLAFCWYIRCKLIHAMITAANQLKRAQRTRHRKKTKWKTTKQNVSVCRIVQPRSIFEGNFLFHSQRWIEQTTWNRFSFKFNSSARNFK